MNKPFIEVEHLRQYFPAGGFGKNRKYVQAVDDVSFTIAKRETPGPVGASGPAHPPPRPPTKPPHTAPLYPVMPTSV